MTKRTYTLTPEEAADASRQIATLTWPDGSPIRLGDFGSRLKISGLLFQGEGVSILIETPTTHLPGSGMLCLVAVDPGTSEAQAQLHKHQHNYGMHPDLLTWCDIVKRTDDPVIFEQDETGMLKAVHRKVRFQISGGVQWAIWDRDGFQCLYCGKHGGKGVPLTVDHVIPLEMGGEDNSHNYATACRRCNKLKGSREPQTFCEEQGYDYEGLMLFIAGKAPKSFIAHL